MDITVTMKVVDLFFDNPAIIRRLDVANRRALSKAGAFVRRAAISRLRRRKRPSLPGESPSVHSTDPIANLRFILFGFDGRDSVIIGPVGLNQKQYLNGKLSSVVDFAGRFVNVTHDANGQLKTITSHSISHMSRPCKKYCVKVWESLLPRKPHLRRLTHGRGVDAEN